MNCPFVFLLVKTSTGQKKVYSTEGDSVTSKLFGREFICKEPICVLEKLKRVFLFLRDISILSQWVEVSKFLRFCPTIFRGTLVRETHCLMLTHMAQRIFL